MKHIKHIALSAVFTMAGCGTTGGQVSQDTSIQPDSQLYTTYNIWLMSKRQSHNQKVINYKLPKAPILPAGTPVHNVSIVEPDIGSVELPYITFTTDQNKTYEIKFTPKFHPGKSIKDHKKLMFSTASFGELTDGMTEVEIKSIKQGVIRSGMSKKAVLTSYGYPPEHQTPILRDSEWVYWTKRFRRKTICFDENEMTTTCSGHVIPHDAL
ncbi:MAG: hypothetical protein KZQ99_18200 [Candidatus Thiodiazotropha sp. (ex Dulcina madagascariensis)]|nr:hypothetical protein [Candidatus Thiodiazotropha sp. (ex Dulcina madagascariensis)]